MVSGKSVTGKASVCLLKCFRWIVVEPLLELQKVSRSHEKLKDFCWEMKEALGENLCHDLTKLNIKPN